MYRRDAITLMLRPSTACSGEVSCRKSLAAYWTLLMVLLEDTTVYSVRFNVLFLCEGCVHTRTFLGLHIAIVNSISALYSIYPKRKRTGCRNVSFIRQKQKPQAKSIPCGTTKQYRQRYLPHPKPTSESTTALRGPCRAYLVQPKGISPFHITRLQV